MPKLPLHTLTVNIAPATPDTPVATDAAVTPVTPVRPSAATDAPRLRTNMPRASAAAAGSAAGSDASFSGSVPSETGLARPLVVPLAASSLNAGDVFILDLGLTIYQWNGSEANKKEKAKALDVCVGIKDDERGGKAKMLVVAQGEEPPEFWEALGGQGPIGAATDDDVKGTAEGEAKLIKVSDASGTLEQTEVASGSLSREMLDPDDVFIGIFGLIVIWAAVAEFAPLQDLPAAVISPY